MKAYDMKKGTVVEHNNTAYQIREIERSSPQGRGGNVTYRFTMYSVPGGNKADISLKAEEELREVELQRRQATFSYEDGDDLVFLDDNDYSPYNIPKAVLGEDVAYVLPDLEGYYVQIIDDMPVGVQFPQNITVEVVETPPELKGGTATKRPTPAKLSNGMEIMVPEYIANGERIILNTTTGEFAGRAD